MDIRTIRIPLSIVAVLVLVGVLAFLLMESRAVENDYYLSHAAKVRALDAAQTDIAAITDGASTAFRDAAEFSPTLVLALSRLEENNRVLQDVADMPRPDVELAAQLAAFDAALAAFLADSREFSSLQNALVGDLQQLQQQSPLLVRYLRDQGLTAQSQRGFSLAIDLLEYASGKAAGDSASMLARINEWRNETSIVPETSEQVGAFTELALSVVAARAASETALAPIGASPVQTELGSLARRLDAANAETTGRAERARILLAGCAIVLLLSATYAVYRLQGSYRALNRSNAELEARVLERTNQLSTAYEDLKESQVQLIHAEKMSSLGEMVAGISHEINTPLWYLMNNSSVIQERLDIVSELCDVNESMLAAVRARKSVNEAVGRGLRDLDQLMRDGIRDDIDEARNLVQDSIDGLDDLTKLAQGLKDFSRLDRAAQGEFDINEGLDRTLLIAKNKIKHKATVHKHYGEIPQVVCSPSQLNQVFLNLLTNAVDAIEDTGDIVIHTTEQDGAVEVSISDNGCGIPADVMAKIRNPFFTTKDVGQGTGLGLSIVDRIVTQHGGELRIESEPGKGTTVTVVLPVNSPDILPLQVLAEQQGAALTNVSTEGIGPQEVAPGATGLAGGSSNATPPG